ncbi:putative ankyrin repeat domain-containing protein 20A12 [Schistocerca americana]|uniref:putative ankyrin repeat domain-containing protein 20A12 n=1 Tax=Schistocerca americana TaxID=7009 RepID=UPI001F4F6761|nr:putative ankyrin repeat domain-containing protein 20A12 [Schistocerca americana]
MDKDMAMQYREVKQEDDSETSSVHSDSEQNINESLSLVEKQVQQVDLKDESFMLLNPSQIKKEKLDSEEEDRDQGNDTEQIAQSQVDWYALLNGISMHIQTQAKNLSEHIKSQSEQIKSQSEHLKIQTKQQLQRQTKQIKFQNEQLKEHTKQQFKEHTKQVDTQLKKQTEHIEKVHNKIGFLTEELINMKSNIKDLKEDVSNIQTEIVEINARFETEVEKIQEQVEPMVKAEVKKEVSQAKETIIQRNKEQISQLRNSVQETEKRAKETGRTLPGKMLYNATCIQKKVTNLENQIKNNISYVVNGVNHSKVLEGK